ncbi:flavinator of succinate dehydrogenase domain-containing protein [Trichoderma breve]|uniref:Succinate dehydrogenase assembly factor 2, mitochondrial n=1 Tax=Trichoderma breve TaxID=2034170 RepID=A0A9W9E2Z9_9HYPO|nr:flavinator of succinate dehydrogenase domain-containing protein [Trichoderma breve]KAJ4856054.1 flavinator of succinate dehydrogenase domain-containing protein [Trichoderma breve]
MSLSVGNSLRPAAFRCVGASAVRMRCAFGTTALRRSESSTPGELGVGELQGATFRIEPLRRVGEDASTMRARLLYQSRKRGTLESDLLLSTFASQNLPTMTAEELRQYDLFLDENDWDIYYWATQREPNSTTNPSRWKDSEILEKLRAHVRRKSVNGGEGTGMAFMPPLES